MKIHLNPEVKISFKEFQEMFADNFKHIVKKDRRAAMKTEYERAINEDEQENQSESPEKEKEIVVSTDKD